MKALTFYVTLPIAYQDVKVHDAVGACANILQSKNLVNENIKRRL